MRANIGFLLIGLGLVGAYIALGGKFSHTSTQSNSVPAIDNTAKNPDVAFPGQSVSSNDLLIPHANRGGGGMSYQSKITQLGHIVAIHPIDRYASKGGMR